MALMREARVENPSPCSDSQESPHPDKKVQDLWDSTLKGWKRQEREAPLSLAKRNLAPAGPCSAALGATSARGPRALAESAVAGRSGKRAQIESLAKEERKWPNWNRRGPAGIIKWKKLQIMTWPFGISVERDMFRRVG